MKRLTLKQMLILVTHGLAGWALCAATIGIGMAVAAQQIALIVHAIAAPLIFAVIAWFYFTRFNYTLPLYTAEAFVLMVVLMDVFVVAMLIQKSFAMFESFLGAWLPFILIFISTLVTSYALKARKS
jgi:hypothetical protein